MALESIPEVRQHILEVMSEAVGKFFLDCGDQSPGVS